MKHNIRRARTDDLDAITALEKDSFLTPWTRDALRAELENKCARYLLLEQNGQTLAYGGFWLVMEEAYITRIATRPDARGHGYGEALLRGMHQLAANLGTQYFTLEVRASNASAQRLYEKCGYIRVGLRKRYYEDTGEDALVLLCQNLPPPNNAYGDDEAFVAE